MDNSVQLQETTMVHPAVQIPTLPVSQSLSHAPAQQWDPESIGSFYQDRPKREAALRVHRDIDSSPEPTGFKGRKRGLTKKKVNKKASKRLNTGKSGSVPLKSVSANITQSSQTAIFLPDQYSKVSHQNLLPAPPGSILDVNDLLILHPPLKPLPTPMLSTIKSPFQQYNRGIEETSHNSEPYVSPFEMYTCRMCSKPYDGKNSRSVARRHLQDKHGISLLNQPRRSRWDYNPERPKTKEEKDERKLSSKRHWAVKHRQRTRLERLHSDYLETFGPNGLETPQGIQLVAPIFRDTKRRPKRSEEGYQDGSLGNTLIPKEFLEALESLDQQPDGNDDDAEGSEDQEGNDALGGITGETVVRVGSRLHLDRRADLDAYGNVEEDIDKDVSINKTPISNTRSTAQTETRVHPPPAQPKFNPRLSNQEPSSYPSSTHAQTQYQLELSDYYHATIEVVQQSTDKPGVWSITSRPGYEVNPDQVFEAIQREDDRMMARGFQPDFSIERRLYFAYVPLRTSAQPRKEMDLQPTHFEPCDLMEGDTSEDEHLPSSPPSEHIDDSIHQDPYLENQKWVEPLSTGEAQYHILPPASCSTDTNPVSDLALLDHWYTAYSSFAGTEWQCDEGGEVSSGEMTVAAESLLDLHSSPMKVTERKSTSHDSTPNELTMPAPTEPLTYGLPQRDHFQPRQIQPTPTRKGLTRSQTISAFPQSRPEAPTRSLSYSQLNTTLSQPNESFGILDDPFVFESPISVVSNTQLKGRPKSATIVSPFDRLGSVCDTIGGIRAPLGRVTSTPINGQDIFPTPMRRNVSDSAAISFWNDTLSASNNDDTFKTPRKSSISFSESFTTLNNIPSSKREMEDLDNLCVPEKESEDEEMTDFKTLTERWLNLLSSPAVPISPAGNGSGRRGRG